MAVAPYVGFACVRSDDRIDERLFKRLLEHDVEAISHMLVNYMAPPGTVLLCLTAAWLY